MHAAIAAVGGGILIGLAAVVLILGIGRIAGISGILGGLLRNPAKTAGKDDVVWRIAFLAGLVAGPFVAAGFGAALPTIHVEASAPLVALAGLLVGFGTRLGSGCTSGHGVCGLARFSRRSVAATLIFMSVAAGFVFAVRHTLGG